VLTNNRPAFAQIRRENTSPSTPSIRKVRPPPGPSPLSLKRSASSGPNTSSSDRPRKRRTRSSDVIFQRRVSTLLEQAQSMFKSDDEGASPSSEEVNPSTEFAFDGDLDLLEAELQFDSLSSDGFQRMEVEMPSEKGQMNSDDLFDGVFDELNPEELEALDSSSRHPTIPETQIVHLDEDDVLFSDGYDELMDFDFNETQPEVQPSYSD
jgi:hypothetical protein